MRELKFRGWFNSSPAFKDHPNGHYKYFDGIEDAGYWSDPGSCILQQFTGLKDKSGIDIYEGDVLQCLYEQEEEPEIVIGEVIFNEEEAVYSLLSEEETDYLFNAQVDIYAKIIGNIYEHPEILEKIKKRDKP